MLSACAKLLYDLHESKHFRFHRIINVVPRRTAAVSVSLTLLLRPEPSGTTAPLLPLLLLFTIFICHDVCFSADGAEELASNPTLQKSPTGAMEFEFAEDHRPAQGDIGLDRGPKGHSPKQ